MIRSDSSAKYEGGVSLTLNDTPLMSRMRRWEDDGAVHASQIEISSSGLFVCALTVDTAMFLTHCCRIASCACLTFFSDMRKRPYRGASLSPQKPSGMPVYGFKSASSS